jgi:hypothetical protein
LTSCYGLLESFFKDLLSVKTILLVPFLYGECTIVLVYFLFAFRKTNVGRFGVCFHDNLEDGFNDEENAYRNKQGNYQLTIFSGGCSSGLSIDEAKGWMSSGLEVRISNDWY